MNLNLFMAIFWLVIGAGLVIYHTLYPDEQAFRLRFIDVSPGWLILVLALWNVVRWWGARAAEKDRQFHEQLAFQRQRKHYEELARKEEKPVVNPEFDFSKPAPPDGEAPAGDRPPAP
jgi:hypothetical protein